ncbi:MAG: hypothetical protein WDO16_03375 [Bacteroidota bacterium]
MITESLETARQLSPDHIFESEVPVDDIIIVIDNQKISQVLINVLTNAIKYSSPGTKIVLTAITAWRPG